jgi:hypothetical protein
MGNHPLGRGFRNHGAVGASIRLGRPIAVGLTLSLAILGIFELILMIRGIGH